MADDTTFRLIVSENDQQTNKYLLSLPFPYNTNIVEYGLGERLIKHTLSAVTITAANTGQASDSILVGSKNNLATIAENAVFTEALKTAKENKLAFLGWVIMIDMSTFSPNTDADQDIDCDLTLYQSHNGAVPDYAAADAGNIQLHFTAEELAEAAAIESVKHIGPFGFLEKYKPKTFNSSTTLTHYLGGELEIREADASAFTAVTTITLSVTTSILLATEKLINKFSSMKELTDILLK